jgi:hypothetical protein
LQPNILAEDEYEPHNWHWMYFKAFDALRYDRFYGAMGGQGPINYMALSQYARDHGLTGSALQHFHIFMNAVDAEYLDMQRAEEADSSAESAAEQ